MKRTVLGPLTVTDLSSREGLSLSHREINWIRIGSLISGKIDLNSNFGKFLTSMSMDDKVKITIEKL